jgi:hypothetical protein
VGEGGSGGGKTAGTVGDLAKGEGEIAGLSKLESGALKFGSLAEMFLPGPQDVLFMILAAAADYAAAKETREREAFTMGFAQALAARLLRKDRMWVNSELKDRACGPGDWGCGLTNARNEGIRAGWEFAVRLPREYFYAFEKIGRTAAATKNLDVRRTDPTRDDVINLGIALLPTVNQVFKEVEENKLQQTRACTPLKYFVPNPRKAK